MLSIILSEWSLEDYNPNLIHNNTVYNVYTSINNLTNYSSSHTLCGAPAVTYKYDNFEVILIFLISFNKLLYIHRNKVDP